MSVKAFAFRYNSSKQKIAQKHEELGKKYSIYKALWLLLSSMEDLE